MSKKYCVLTISPANYSKGLSYIDFTSIIAVKNAAAERLIWNSTPSQDWVLDNTLCLAGDIESEIEVVVMQNLNPLNSELTREEMRREIQHVWLVLSYLIRIYPLHALRTSHFADQLSITSICPKPSVQGFGWWNNTVTVHELFSLRDVVVHCTPIEPLTWYSVSALTSCFT